MAGPKDAFMVLAAASTLGAMPAPAAPPASPVQQFVTTEVQAMKDLTKMAADKDSPCADLKSIYASNEQTIASMRQLFGQVPMMAADMNKEAGKLDEATGSAKAAVEKRCGPMKPPAHN